ncbi:MAG: hypothetical protein IJX40_03450 [Alistipes sp.]|nr:hypothetical protein [Alistipes sp.]
MANKVQMPENDLMVETKGKLELFFDKYGNKLLKGLLAVTLIAVAVFAWVSISSNSDLKRENAAQAALTVALTTEGDVAVFEAIVNEYEGTKAANTAAYLAGAEYLKAGDIANAKASLAKYADVEGAAGEVINALVYTLRGDVAVEENDLQTAADLYRKAIAANDEASSVEAATKKLALVLEAMGDKSAAMEAYKALVEKHPDLKAQYAKYIFE